jgi:hypothetical protein
VKLVSHDKMGAVIHLSWDEMAIMSYTVGDAIGKIEDWEFPILTGGSRELAKALRVELAKALDREPAS